MKTAEELIAEAKAAHDASVGSIYNVAALIAAVEEGLVDGDKIWIGGNHYAHIIGDEVSVQADGKESLRQTIESLTDKQVEQMIVAKAVDISRRGSSMGTPK